MKILLISSSPHKEKSRTFLLAKEVLKGIGMAATEKTVFYRGSGCSNCMNTGYKGRIAIHELLVIDDKIRKALSAKSSTDEIRKAALSAGMISLKDDGISKIEEGLTTAEEVFKATAGTL